MPEQGLRVEALGVAGAPAPNRLTTTFRLAGGVVLDTGAAAHGIAVEDRKSIDRLLLSHAHLDHTMGLPFLLGTGRPTVVGLKQTLDAVRAHLLDGHIWPDLSDLADWHEVTIGDTFEAGPWQVEVGPANHTVPCVSYLFRSNGYAVAVVGDTRYDDSVADWVAQREPDACVTEVSFSDTVGAMARRFGHQTPRDLRKWRSRLGRECRLHVTHLKPSHEERIKAESVALQDPNLNFLRDGDVLNP